MIEYNRWPLLPSSGGDRVTHLPDGRLGTKLFRIDCPAGTTRYLKVTAAGSYERLEAERERLRWLSGRLPVPFVLHSAEHEGRALLLLSGLPGLPAHLSGLSPRDLVSLFAEGLQQIHALPTRGCPFWQPLEQDLSHAAALLASGRLLREPFVSASGRGPEVLLDELASTARAGSDLVFTHGDYCLPNVLVDEGRASGFVDWGLAGVADRHRDLAIAADSVQFNLGPEWVEPFLDAYGRTRIEAAQLRFYALLDLFFTHLDLSAGQTAA